MCTGQTAKSIRGGSRPIKRLIGLGLLLLVVWTLLGIKPVYMHGSSMASGTGIYVDKPPRIIMDGHLRNLFRHI